MPRKKMEPAEKSTPVSPDVATVTLNIPKSTYTQIERIATSWGYSVDEWFRETIENAV